MEIMATTTNNHNQKELRLYVPNEQHNQQNTNSALTSVSGARSPFQREVREWQRIDPDTGALLTGRLEADRWINGPLNKYGKISDSQNISQPNGTQQTQRKQLEVLQTCTANGGAMQVIRTQHVQTTSSRWSTSSASASASPLLLSANTSPIPQQQQQQKHLQSTHRNGKHSFKQKTHNSSNVSPSTDHAINTKSPFTTTQLLTNGFNHKPNQHQLHDHQQQQHFVQLQQQYKKLQPFPTHSLVNGITNGSSSSSRNRNWLDLNENMSTLDICDNEHDNEHDHDSDYIVEQQESSDEQPSDNDNNDNEYDDDSLMYNNENNDDGDDDEENDVHHHHHHLLLNKRNNLKNVDLTKRHSFTVFNKNDYHYNDHDSHHQHHYQHNNKNIKNSNNNHEHSNNLSRDSSSGSCSNNNNNQLFLLDTAPSLKLSNLMKSSSSLSNSSNNSTTAATAVTNPSSMNTHKSMGSTNKVSLHCIVGNNNNNTTTATTTTTSSTLSPTTTTTIRPSWQQQPTLYRQNSYNNSNNAHLMKTRVGDTNNCCSNNSNHSSSDESRSNAGKTDTDHRRYQQRQQSPKHHQQQQQEQQQIHLKQNDRLTPTHLPHSYHRVDLESFRLYNNNNDNNNTSNEPHDDEGLRPFSRNLRRQQSPNEPSTNTLQRSRSISTDDLSTDWNGQGVDSEEPAEWRRVSKLRRSFQSNTKSNQDFSTPTATRRPLDLPTSSVSVSKIRAELENGRRLNTVMRNNHVDLAALSSILNGNDDKETKPPLTPKRSSFLTAESLKEIRGKLKKLSDESLYKEDFLLNQQNNNEANPEVERLVNDQTKEKRNYENSPEKYRVTTKTEEINNKHTTNSLESRLKYRDTNSTDWHIRRKSYGFEKMSPPEKAMLRMDASTDSGLGRSGELQNWSPTSEAATIVGGNNRTVVHLGETSKVTTVPTVPTVQRRYRAQKSYEKSEHAAEEDSAISKRHSIAVDESQYVRDNSRQTTQIHLNGFYEPAHYAKLIHSSESTTTNDRGQQKRVEFSKTEVHFATESGRVNIVETDSKPPPTNNFRRRRSRSSSVGPLQSLVTSATTASTNNAVSLSSSTSPLPTGVALPVTLFGDDSSKRKPIAATMVAYRAAMMGSPEPKDNGINVTVTIPTHNESFAYMENSRSSYAATSGVDTTDCDTDEMISLRGILKNKPAKPKPYVLGENFDKPDELWGVQLKPVGTQIKTERESPTLLNSLPQKSVAERIQELGTAASQSNGFSTKIKVSLGNTTPVNTNNWEDTGRITATRSRPNVQQLLMHDLKEHQKILDEGLKSTTLIIKTMHSATEFDEAMRRLSVASIGAAIVKPTPMFRSNSYQESSHSFDLIKPNIMCKSTSFSSTSSWSMVASSRRYSQDSRKTSTDSGASFPCKDSMPRLSFLQNEHLPVSQQLQRLRLLYDAATASQDEDSADEEVKSYFRQQVDSDSGGGTQDSSSYEDDQCLEQSNSWSRLKAKKTVWKINTENDVVERSSEKTLEKTDLPQSNVMSIKLHSPQASTQVQPPLKVVPPIAKPRTVTTIQESQPPKMHTATTIKQASFQPSLPTNDSLRIIKEARGARQLRNHELSYFGLPVSKSEDENPKPKFASTSTFRNSPKRSLPLRKPSKENFVASVSAQKEQQQQQLENNKPDLLKHNPIEVTPTERTSLKQKGELDEDEEHVYENIANDITPVFKVKSDMLPEQYNRKMDLKRDAMILSEMNKNADQTLRELSDEAALKDRRRRSLQRHNSKPLETIDEKSIAERINDTCIAVKISRGTYASEAKKTSRHSTPSPTAAASSSRERTSSQSSIECCPRARSRSLSSEKEYEITKVKPSRTTQMIKHKSQKTIPSRSSSLDSQKSNNSGEEQQAIRSTGSFRREDRSRTKTKRITSSASSNQRDKQRDNKSQHQHHLQHHHGDSKRLSSTTHSSTHRERVECKHDNANGSSTTTTKQNKHHGNCSELQRSTTASSSGRRQRDDLRDSQRMKHNTNTVTGRPIGEHRDKHEQSSSKNFKRSMRDDERNSSQRSSSHRLERGDKEKEKSSRSTKGHSSRSTSNHHHDRTTNSNKLSTAKDCKMKSAYTENMTSSKNAQQQQHHQIHHRAKEPQQHHSTSKREPDQTEHIHGLKSAIIKTTTKLRDKTRSRKEKI